MKERAPNACFQICLSLLNSPKDKPSNRPVLNPPTVERQGEDHNKVSAGLGLGQGYERQGQGRRLSIPK